MSSLSHDYDAIRTGVGLIDRSDRALLEVTGRDRVTWLHNLTTNQVKTLQQGEGNYAFCLSVQGRILFDLNILVRPESIWLDLDRGFVDTARKHFDKYTITEDVKIADRSGEFRRLALVGDGVKAFLADQGVPHVATLPLLGSTEVKLAGAPVIATRTDLCGPFAIELFAAAEQAAFLREDLLKNAPVVEVGSEAVQVHRIEAGIPWPGHEITEEYLPAETGQLRRAVSFQKGCYLGQEVVERMRSRGVVARLLRGLLIQGDIVPPPGASVVGADGKTVGTVTSLCRSLALNQPIAMAYVKTAGAAPNQPVDLTWTGGAATATVIELPFTRGQAD